MADQSTVLTVLDQEGDQALFEGKFQAVVMVCYENERPLQGLAGLLDWRFHGILSHCAKQGALSGRKGECVYVPARKNGIAYHLILAGAGPLSAKGERKQIPPETFSVLQKNLASLRFPQIGISRSDFGDLPDDSLGNLMKGIPLCIVR